MNKEIVIKYLDSIGAYYRIANQWETRDGSYFLINEDPGYTTIYVLRVNNYKVYNCDNDIVYRAVAPHVRKCSTLRDMMSENID